MTSPGTSADLRRKVSFYDLKGIESPHAYLLQNARNRQFCTTYPRHLDTAMESNYGKVISAEDSELRGEPNTNILLYFYQLN